MTTKNKIDWKTEVQAWVEKNEKQKRLPQDLEQTRNEFITKFPISKLGELTLEQYALGRPDAKESFCWWLEDKTKKLGAVGGRNVTSWQVWWDKQTGAWKHVKKYANADDALSKIRATLVQLVSNVESGNFQGLDEVGNQLPPSLRLKPLYLYFPDKFLPIFNANHIEYFLQIFEESALQGKDNVIALNQQLLKTLKEKKEFSSFDTHGMMGFLYGRFSEVKKDLKPQDKVPADAILVGAAKSVKDFESVTIRLQQKAGKMAFWWSFPLKQEHEAILKQMPYLYVYVGGNIKRVLYRYHVLGWKTSTGDAGIKCPEEWEANIENDKWKGKARLPDEDHRGKAGIFKTWFLVDKIKSIPETPLEELIGLDGKPVTPLRAAFWIVRPIGKPPEPSPLLDQLENLTKYTRNIILYGPPGTGKTFIAREFVSRFQKKFAGRFQYRFVTFHQSFAYEEFVEGIRAESKEGQPPSYLVKPGIFREFCDEARKKWEDAGKDESKAERYLLIIDEINRANIAKVLGELITLIEDDKRLARESDKKQLEVKLPYSGRNFGVPPNVYLLGTMNTADRSIALLDTALRRRFAFMEIMPDARLLKPVAGVNLGKLLTVLNSRIAVLKDRDHQVGHSYFMHIDDETHLQFAWYHKVVPLLQEYFYNDGKQLQAVLGERFVKAEKKKQHVEGSLGDLFDPDEEIYEIQTLKDPKEFIEALKEIADKLP